MKNLSLAKNFAITTPTTATGPSVFFKRLQAVSVRGAAALAESLASRRSDALLYKRLATLRRDVPLTEIAATGGGSVSIGNAVPAAIGVSSISNGAGAASTTVTAILSSGAGLVVGAVGNMAMDHEELVRPHVDFVSSSERWQVEKPSPGFFTRVVEAAGRPAAKIAYVGDRVDNDIEPAVAAGMVAVHIRRGPWGYLQEPPPEAVRIRSLDELPAVLT